MRILVFSDVTGYMRGGVPAETRELLRGLQNRGHQMALMADIPLEGTEGVTHFRLSLPIDRTLSRQLRGAIDAFKPDLVHVIGLNSRGIAQISPWMKTVPWLITCHGVPPYERKLACLHGNEFAHYFVRSLRFAPNTLAWKWLFRSGAIPRAIVHSQSVADIVGQYGLPAPRINLIPLGCEVSESVLRPPRPIDSTRPLRLASVGGIAHTKGYHDAIKALSEVQRTIPTLEYTIIGEARDQSYMRYLQKLIVRFGLSKSVRFLLDASDDEKDDVLQNADIYLQPSHEEGFCLSYIEAASIVPLLIGTDTGAIRAISATDAGARVVPARQPARIADAISELCRTSLPPEFLVGRRARLASDFSWSAHIDAHETLYTRLIR